MKEVTIKEWHAAKMAHLKKWRGRRPKCIQCRKSLSPQIFGSVRIIDSRNPHDYRTDFTSELRWWGYDNWNNFCSAKCAVLTANLHHGKREVP